MIYIVFTVTTIINIFNIVLIANNKVTQELREKVLLITYTVAELFYIQYILFSINYTAVNTILVISFLSIWLLSKSYILLININFDEINVKGCSFMENDKLDKNVNELENNTESEEILNEGAAENLLEPLEIELPDIVESSININNDTLAHNSLYELSDMVNDNKLKEAQEVRERRRKLALKMSKITKSE